MPLCVIGIDSERNSLDLSTGHVYDMQIVYPIPLTEEWLLKLGFVKDEMKRIDGYDTETPFKITIEKPGYSNSPWVFEVKSLKSSYNPVSPWVIYWLGNIVFHASPWEPHCVHQIQNLYFALTGEELSIKE